MKTKIVYVLVSGMSDNYLEQMLISIYSLRIYNSQTTVLLIIDDKTKLTLNNGRAKILDCVDDVVVVELPPEYNNKRRSRFLKTSVRNYISGAFLFIDTDTVITADLSSIDSCDADIAAVKDMHCSIKENFYRKEIERTSKKIAYRIGAADEYFNSGVIYVKDSVVAKSFYHKWHENWLYSCSQGIYTDQPSFLKTNGESGGIINELSGVWNCQIINNITFLSESKIIHYFCSGIVKGNANPPYFLMNRKIVEQIRKEDYMISEELKDSLLNARNEFEIPLEIYSGKDLELLHSRQFLFLKHYFYSCYSLYTFCDKILYTIRHLF